MCSTWVNGANILCLFTSQSPSHNIVHMGVAEALIVKGHNLTILSSLPIKTRKGITITNIVISPKEE